MFKEKHSIYTVRTESVREKSYWIVKLYELECKKEQIEKRGGEELVLSKEMESEVQHLNITFNSGEKSELHGINETKLHKCCESE